jgi:Family of unknown function (DUF6064)
MSDWWTYAPSDFLLFSPATYRRLLELLHHDVWPAQLVALALGAGILALLRARSAWRQRCVAAILAAAWLHVAWAFHYERYATINWAAPYFAVAFAIEAALLLWIGAAAARLAVGPPTDWTGRVGLALLVFALIVQPCLGVLHGRPWTQAAMFGITPDPTVVATLGALLTTDVRARWALLGIPMAWCVVGGIFLWAMEEPGYVVMAVAGILSAIAAVAQRRRGPLTSAVRPA